jgi:hypothetical protein
MQRRPVEVRLSCYTGNNVCKLNTAISIAALSPYQQNGYLGYCKLIKMSPDGIKKEIKLYTEVIKFLLVVLLAAAGGMTSLYAIEKPSHSDVVLISVGWFFIPIILLLFLALFLYIYSLSKKI